MAVLLPLSLLTEDAGRSPVGLEWDARVGRDAEGPSGRPAACEPQGALGPSLSFPPSSSTDPGWLGEGAGCHPWTGLQS